MSRRRTSPWWVFAGCALLAFTVLAWVTQLALALERDQTAVRRRAEFQDDVTDALWGMDSLVGPWLRREAGRPYFDYLSFVPHERAYTRILRAIEPGEVLSPSPLLTFRSEVLALHFQVDAQGNWSSPQVPDGNLLDLAQAGLVDGDEIAERRALLEDLKLTLDWTALAEAIADGEALLADWLVEPGIEGPEGSAPLDQRRANEGRNKSQQQSAQLDYVSRARRAWTADGRNDIADNSIQPAPLPNLVGGQPVLHGPLVPVWLESLDSTEPPTLLYARRVDVDGEMWLQGVLVDWEKLEAGLLSEARSVLPDARLVPERSGERLPGRTLATLPARLEASPGAAAKQGAWSAVRSALAVAWAATALVLGAAAFTLRGSLALGERRARFASAVTHELRTPLTTFRMYSEMLQKDMVPKERRAEYLETLRSESDRLAELVENVLAYARVEEGREPLRRELVTFGQLIEEVRPGLERRSGDGGDPIQTRGPGADADAELETDVRAVEQILANLVDNAVKYGRPPITLECRVQEGRAWLSVSDSGDGVERRHAAAIFRPFERGSRGATASASPAGVGVGLGLALARGLARDLGGELSLEDRDEPGACFVLVLPLAQPVGAK